MAKNFLVIRWSGMGDIVMALPALRFLKEREPGCHVTFLTDRAFSAIPRWSNLADEVVFIDRQAFKNPRTRLKAASGAVAAVRALRKRKYDIAFDLQGFGETALLAFLSGSPARVGRVKGSKLRERIYTRNIRQDWATVHRSRFFVDAVAFGLGVGQPEAFDPPAIFFDSVETAFDRPTVALNIGASTPSRRWPEDRFLRLAGELSRQGFGAHFLLGPQEAFLLEEVRNGCEANGWTFALHREMGPLAKDIAGCSLMVSNDTGPGHLAAAMGLPVVTLFSTGDPDNVRPLAPRSRWFRDAEEIGRIDPMDVLAACLELLS